MFQGIELVAKIERVSKKKAARFLIEEGFRKYIGNKLGEAIKTEVAARELRRKPKLTCFVLELSVCGQQKWDSALGNAPSDHCTKTHLVKRRLISSPRSFYHLPRLNTRYEGVLLWHRLKIRRAPQLMNALQPKL